MDYASTPEFLKESSAVKAAQAVNLRQHQRFAQRVIDDCAERAAGITLAVWGLAFKGKTDDIRESPAVSCVQEFLKRGIAIQAYDPEAASTAKWLFGETVTFCRDGYDALEGAGGLVVLTDWQQSRKPRFQRQRREAQTPHWF